MVGCTTIPEVSYTWINLLVGSQIHALTFSWAALYYREWHFLLPYQWVSRKVWPMGVPGRRPEVRRRRNGRLFLSFCLHLQQKLWQELWLLPDSSSLPSAPPLSVPNWPLVSFIWGPALASGSLVIPLFAITPLALDIAEAPCCLSAFLALPSLGSQHTTLNSLCLK